MPEFSNADILKALNDNPGKSQGIFQRIMGPNQALYNPVGPNINQSPEMRYPHGMMNDNAIGASGLPQATGGMKPSLVSKNTPGTDDMLKWGKELGVGDINTLQGVQALAPPNYHPGSRESSNVIDNRRFTWTKQIQMILDALRNR